MFWIAQPIRVMQMKLQWDDAENINPPLYVCAVLNSPDNRNWKQQGGLGGTRKLTSPPS